MLNLVNRLAGPCLKSQVRQFSFVAMNNNSAVSRLSARSSALASSTQSNFTSPTYTSNIISTNFNTTNLSPLSSFFQLRWGTRGGSLGRTYQPNTLKRKRRLGFLARMKSRTGRNIVKDRRVKGRWFLTH